MRRIVLTLSIVLGLAVPSSVFASIHPASFPDCTSDAVAAYVDVELVDQISGNAEAVTAHESYVYAAIDSRLAVIDASNPARPRIVGRTGVLPGSIEDLAWADDRVYVANHTGGVRIVDVTNPANPAELGVCNTPGEAYGVAVSGNYAYVADGSAGFQVCNVSNPATSSVVGSCADFDGGWGYGVAVSGSYAYVGAWGLHVLDISNPQAPSRVGSYQPEAPEGYSRKGVAVVGNRVFVGEYRYTFEGAEGGGVRVINVSNPYNPTPLGFYTSPAGRVDGVTVINNRAYVADGEGGLRVVDVSASSNPTEIGGYDTSGDAEKVVSIGNYVYVANREGGLLVLWAVQSTVASVPVGNEVSIPSTADSTAYVFPAGTFTDTVVLTHTAKLPSNAPSPGDLTGIWHFFEVTAVYSGTNRPAEPAPGQVFTITVEYTATERGPAIEDTLGLYWWDESVSQWSQQGITSTVKTADHMIVAEVDHLSTFAVLGETRRVYLPLALRNQ